MQAPVVKTEEYDDSNPRHRMVRAQTELMSVAASLARRGMRDEAIRIRDAVDTIKRLNENTSDE